MGGKKKVYSQIHFTGLLRHCHWKENHHWTTELLSSVSKEHLVYSAVSI